MSLLLGDKESFEQMKNDNPAVLINMLDASNKDLAIRIEEAQSKINDLTSENQKLKQQILSQSQGNKGSLSQFEVVDNQFANSEYLIKQNENLGKQLAETEKENVTLRNQIEQLKAQPQPGSPDNKMKLSGTDLKEYKEKLESELHDIIESMNKQFEDEKRTLTSDNEMHKTQILALKKLLRDSEARCDALRNDLKKYTGEKDQPEENLFVLAQKGHFDEVQKKEEQKAAEENSKPEEQPNEVKYQGQDMKEAPKGVEVNMEKQEKEQTFERCSICFIEILSDNVFTNSCGHNYCGYCVTEFGTGSLSLKVCLLTECGKPLEKKKYSQFFARASGKGQQNNGKKESAAATGKKTVMEFFNNLFK